MERLGIDDGTLDATIVPDEPDGHGLVVVDAAQDGDVDGDFNGAPELARVDETRGWTGVDVLDAMHGRDAEAANAADEAPLAERIDALEQLRAGLVERLEALRAEVPDLEAPDTVGAEDASPAANAAVVAASLREQIAHLDDGLERLRDRSLEP
jgi:hypothetical protein